MIVKLISDEVARLQLDLEAVEKQRDSLLDRISCLKTYLTIHAEFSNLGNMQVSEFLKTADRNVDPAIPRIVSSPRAPGSGDRIMRAVVDILRNAGRPVLTRDLLKPLGEVGIQLGGGDDTRATSHLSSVLSKHRTVLRASRRLGWSLVEWGEDEAAIGSTASDGSDADLDPEHERRAVHLRLEESSEAT